MSLFGSSPEDSPLASKAAQPSSSRAKSTLFAEDASSLFGADEGFSSQNGNNRNTSNSHARGVVDNGDNRHDDGYSTPWDMPTPRKSGSRQQIVKTLLPSTDVPESYIDAFDALVEKSGAAGGDGGIGVEEAKSLLGSTHLSPSEQAGILNLVTNNGAQQSLERNEFNVLLALVGLAQEGEDVTFDSVDERRKRLPEPNIPYITRVQTGNAGNSGNGTVARQPTEEQPVQIPQTRRRLRQDSFGPEADPWGSPVNRQPAHRPNQGVSNGFSSAHEAPEPEAASKPNTRTEPRSFAGPRSNESTGGPSSVGSGWGGGGFGNPSSASGFGNYDQGALGSGFGQPDNGQVNSSRNDFSRSLGDGHISNPGMEDVITIQMLPEKEGMFLFQHRNYEVKSARKATSVIRRYSDFVWLVDCLQKKYPFRQIPLLPPKRVAVNGTHLSADSNSFLDKRRRGLVRFANALVRHPVLSQEQLVVMFFTVPTELAVWRKQASISVQEEFTDKPLPPDLEDSLPSNLTDTFDTVRSGVRRSADIHINLCLLMDRLVKRHQGLAAEQFRVSRALHALTESTMDTYAADTSDVLLLNNGINATANHLQTSQGLLEDEAKAWDLGVLEDLKAQRDCLVAMRDVFDRRDRFAKDNIPQLERRIENNEKKLQAIRAKPEEAVKPGEAKKVEDAIIKDKESIVQQHARGVFIKECIRDEILIFQRSQYRISLLHQDWSQERVKYAELQADNWRALTDVVEGMPTSD
ncbi:Sorting nexin mvp1 [Microsporum canis]|uniref:Sorting nexin MVP1 n=1 Tax=Arthroderma otae (strain ATCC MYA-4605 / CBS 113480) TaxID=554155 RepID=C5FMK9_ARTOC|nr:sorting nexin Mvp1 [Microsporum canis CBS 113480]EEQ31112.1 sorting nexin Mvp1 [Microsporum canis CBS 113480]